MALGIGQISVLEGGNSKARNKRDVQGERSCFSINAGSQLAEAQFCQESSSDFI